MHMIQAGKIGENSVKVYAVDNAICTGIFPPSFSLSPFPLSLMPTIHYYWKVLLSLSL